MGRSAGDAGHPGSAGHGEHDDSGIAGRTHGWSRRRAPAAGNQPTGTTGRLRRDQSVATAVVPAAWGATASRWKHRPTDRAGPVSAVMRLIVGGGRRGLVLLIAAVLLTSCTWRGIANVPLPMGRATGSQHMTI